MSHDFSKDDRRNCLGHAVRLADTEIAQTNMTPDVNKIVDNAKKFEEYLRGESK